MKYIDKPELKKNKKNRFLSGAIAIFMALSGGAMLTACKDEKKPNPDDEQKPPIIVETPEEDKTIDEVNAEFEIVRNKIAMTDNVTFNIKSPAREEMVYEIHGNLMKVTDKNGTKIYEKTTDGNFVYSLNNEEWQKDKAAEGIPTAEDCKQQFDQLLDTVDLEKVENKTVVGTMSTINGEKVNIIYAYDEKTDTLTIKSDAQTVTVSNANKTNVKVPTEYTDNTQEKPPVEDFKVEEHLDELVEKLQPTLEVVAKRYNENIQEPKLFKTYLRQRLDHIDTVGLIFKEKYGTLIYSEITKKV